MGIPTGSYPKMVTGTDSAGHIVPLIYPPGDAKQFNFVILADANAEKVYTGNGVLVLSNVSSGHSNSWENRHGR